MITNAHCAGQCEVVSKNTKNILKNLNTVGQESACDENTKINLFIRK